MKKLIILCFLVAMVCVKGWGQYATWTLTSSNTPASCGFTTAGPSAGSSVSSVTSVNATSGYSGVGFTTSINIPGNGGTGYFQFAVTNSAANAITVSAINLNTYYNGTNYMYHTIRYSTNGFSSSTQLNYDQYTPAGSASFTNTGLSISVAAGATLTVRVYGYYTDATTYRFGLTNFQVVTTPINPSSVSATAISSSQINLSATANASSNIIMLAYNTSNTFGTPVTGTSYSAGSAISGGGTVLYVGAAGSPFFNHTSLSPSTTYYYKVWSVSNNCYFYSTGVATNATTLAATNTWNGSIGTDWNTAGNWSLNSVPTSISPVSIPSVTNQPIISSTTAAAAASITLASGTSLTINGTLTNGGNFTNNGATSISGTGTLAFSAAGTIGGTASTTFASGLTVSVPGSTTVTLASGTTTTVNGTLTNAGVVATTGSLVIGSTGTYTHARNNGTIPTATWNSGSTCNITGITGGAPNGLGQSFSNFTWNCPNQSASISLAGALTTVTGNFTVTNTSSSNTSTTGYYLSLFSTTGTLTIGGNFTISGSIYPWVVVNSGTGTATVNIAGNLTTSNTGTLYSNYQTSGTCLYNVTGNCVVAGDDFELNYGSTSVSPALNVTGGLTVASYFVLNSYSTTAGAAVVVTGTSGTTVSGAGSILMDDIGTSGNCFLLTTSFTANGAGNYSSDFGISNCSVDFGYDGTVNHSQIRISGNFSHSSTNVFYTSSVTQVGNFIFNGNATDVASAQTLSYTGNVGSDYTSYIINSNTYVRLLTAFTLSPNNSTSPISSFTVNGTLDCYNSTLTAGTTSGSTYQTFALNSGATLVTANANGFYSGTGAISTVFGASATFNSGANYVFNGTGSQTANFSNTTMNNLGISNTAGTVTLNANITVNGSVAINTGGGSLTGGAGLSHTVKGNWTNNGTFVPNTSTVSFAGTSVQTLLGATNFYNLLFNNAAGFSMANTQTVGSVLTLTSGIVSITTGLVNVTNTAATAVSGGSATAYVNGPLQRSLPATSGNTYAFPVGKSGYYPFALTPASSSSSVVKAEAFSANSNGTAGTGLCSISSTEYWLATVTSGSFTSGTVSLTRTSALGNFNAVGKSSTVNGAYLSLGGSASGTTITSANAAGSSGLGYFVMGTQAPAISGTYTPSVCSGSTFTVTPASSVTGTTYSWSAPSGSVTGGVAATGQSTVTGTLTNNGINPVTATYTVTPSANGCSGSTFTVTPTVAATLTGTQISAPPGAICSGTGVVFTFSGAAGSTVYYTVNSGTQQNVVLNSSGNYPLTVPNITQNTTFQLVSATSGTNNSCTQPLSGNATVNLSSNILWTGNAGSTLWNTGGNWCSGSTPASGVNVTIGSTNGNYPTLPGNITVANLTINANNTVTLGSNILTASAISGTGTLTGSIASDLVVNGGSTLNFTATPGANVLRNLTIGGTGTVTLGNALDITGGSSSGVVTVANGATLATNDVLTLKSDAAGTAAIGANTSGSPYITGKVIVERFTDGKPAANASGSRRAWRLVTSPVTGQTIHEAWQENAASNGDPSPGYGTIITGYSMPSSTVASQQGYDFVGAGLNSSIRKYVAPAGTTADYWTSLPNTGTLTSLQTEPAYLVFVRGDRSVTTGPNTASTVANLRSKGNLLLQGSTTVNYPASTAGTPKVLLGNPYASAISFEKLVAHNPSIDDQFILWNSTYGVYGAYVLIDHNGFNHTYQATPDTISSIPTQNKDRYKFIPSGSGFIVYPLTTSAGSISFQETDKAPGQVPPVNPFRVVNTPTNLRQIVMNLNLRDTSTSVTLADGFRAKFSSDYESAEDDNSVVKAANLNENLGLTQHNRDFIIEAKGEVKKTDTLYMKMWNVVKRSYQFQVRGDNFVSAPGIRAWLEDSYLATKQELALNGSVVTINFEVNADAGSAKSDRFRIVFENNSFALPVTLTKISAQPKNGGVEVGWTVSNETNIKGYTIEKSVDGGRTFTSTGTQQPARNNPQAAVTSYSGYDAAPKNGDNYYRIRIEAKDGTVTYSTVVKVAIGTIGSGIQITLYPNPVREGKASLQLTNLKEGAYLVSIYSGSGQAVYQKKIYVASANGTQTEPLLFGNTLAQGSYPIKVADSKGKVIFTDRLIVGR